VAQEDIDSRRTGKGSSSNGEKRDVPELLLAKRDVTELLLLKRRVSEPLLRLALIDSSSRLRRDASMVVSRADKSTSLSTSAIAVIGVPRLVRLPGRRGNPSRLGMASQRLVNPSRSHPELLL
jgi:hypothetical protein